MAVMMRCGCAAQGKDREGNPVCVAHYGILDGATVVADTPDLTGRVAHCADCGRTTPSDPSLPFFRHQPTWAQDSYYDGCRGWD